MSAESETSTVDTYDEELKNLGDWDPLEFKVEGESSTDLRMESFSKAGCLSAKPELLWRLTLVVSFLCDLNLIKLPAQLLTFLCFTAGASLSVMGAGEIMGSIK